MKTLISYLLGGVFLFVLLNSCDSGFLSDLEDGSTLKDSRDGYKYQIVTIGRQTWMAENLQYETDSGSWIYNNDISNLDLYGRLYNWEAAKVACPQGWHVPTDPEWTLLELHCGMDPEEANANSYRRSGSVGLKLMSLSGWFENGNGTNSYGFSIHPSGFRSFERNWDINTGVYYESNFENIQKSAYLWSSSLFTVEEAIYRGFYYGEPGVDRYRKENGDGLSIRCIKGEKVNTPPKAIFEVSGFDSHDIYYEYGTTITKFTFDASNSNDQESSKSKLSYKWDFNDDGIWETDFLSSPIITHVFGEAGIVWVVLEVSDPIGITNQFKRRFSIEKAAIPVVTTKMISNVTQNSAESGGEVTEEGDRPVTHRGVCWSIEENPTVEDEHSINGAGIGEFTSNLDGLNQDETYYVRAYATNEVGTAFGEQISITTKDQIGSFTDSRDGKTYSWKKLETNSGWQKTWLFYPQSIPHHKDLKQRIIIKSMDMMVAEKI